ncbi:MAG: AmmeMemoRadiSam system protein A [Deltaproteobacteria bacterium]|nr:AmmeMemoRadiSam system protein A [Deltaproteobacteria bacterium]
MSQKKKDVGVDLGLSDEEKELLRRVALQTIEKRARGERGPTIESASDKLKEHRGAFVSLYKKGMLRGCIGSLEGKGPLIETVREMAEAAAFNDPRFRPVTQDELPYLELEISALTPFQEVSDPSEIKVGIHGIIIRKGYFSGVLLPQVATERNWDTITFLEETCRKAGLPRDAWKDKDTAVYVFSADVF